MNNSQVTLGQINVGQSFSLGGVVYTRQPAGPRDTNLGTVPVISNAGIESGFEESVQVRRLSAQGRAAK